jgi:gamma-glutamylcyclotransferase (GGCT)/AIG2-like uncharacterized protein YtfP
MAEEKDKSNDLSFPAMEPGADFLFVYGTLRKELCHKVVKLPENDFVYVGEGQVSALLYDLGDYPAAMRTDGASHVSGDVFEIKNAAGLFRILDEYEGQEYRREKTMVTLSSGHMAEAWIYWYNGRVDEAAQIAGGDYLSHLKTRGNSKTVS